MCNQAFAELQGVGMQGSRSAYTRTRILEAAGRLFAKKGHDNTSLREITAEAQVNVSSVHYHFGSKEGLILAVRQQQLNRLNRERLILLDQLETSANGAALEAAQIVEAYFLPLLQHVLSPSRAAAVASDTPVSSPTDAIAASSSDTCDLVRSLVTHLDAHVIARFGEAVRKALPHIPESEVLWRFQFMLGAVHYVVTGLDGLRLALHRSHSEPFDVDQLCTRLLVFLTAGLLAPMPKEWDARGIRTANDDTSSADPSLPGLRPQQTG